MCLRGDVAIRYFSCTSSAETHPRLFDVFCWGDFDMRIQVWFCCLAFFFLGIANASWAAEKPNILVIVADDLGYHDVGFHGGKEIPTPNIDSIAAGGVKCT